MTHGLHVVVLAGGLSHERDVSVRSGRRVADALHSAGLDATVRDVDPSLLSWLREEEPDCVVPLLHGEAGEDGALREILELADVPYVGSGSAASRVAFDKPIAKEVVAGAGIRTPASVTLPTDAFREIGAGLVMDAVVNRLGLPLAVKPARGGSALGFSAVRTAAEFPAAMVACLAYGDTALIEQLVIGTEVAVGVIETMSGPQPLPAVEICPDGGIYDYTARYTAGATEFIVPARLSNQAAAECADAAVAVHHALRLRDFSRSDLMVDAHGTVWFLEANVAPGMTETSLVPLAIEAAGHELGGVVGDLVRRAILRADDRNRERTNDVAQPIVG
jgi:D-alanine-D-alanine ligase